jgi:hypothetical protein
MLVIAAADVLKLLRVTLTALTLALAGTPLTLDGTAIVVGNGLPAAVG